MIEFIVIFGVLSFFFFCCFAITIVLDFTSWNSNTKDREVGRYVLPVIIIIVLAIEASFFYRAGYICGEVRRIPKCGHCPVY